MNIQNKRIKGNDKIQRNCLPYRVLAIREPISDDIRKDELICEI